MESVDRTAKEQSQARKTTLRAWRKDGVAPRAGAVLATGTFGGAFSWIPPVFTDCTLLPRVELTSRSYPAPQLCCQGPALALASNPVSKTLCHTSRNQKINFPNRN